jgi:membrane-associated phospholipid phosphatase
VSEKNRRFWEITALLSAQMLASLLLFAFAAAVLVFLLRKHLRKYKPVDLAIFDRLQSLVKPSLNRFMLFVTEIGRHTILVPANILLILYFLFIRRQSWFSVRVAAIALSSLVLMLILKNLFGRKRPLSPLLKAARGLSFPSGHAIMSVSFFGLIIYILLHTVDDTIVRTILVALAIVLILLIGFSRVYLRVHYTSDVIAGFIIGLIWLCISLWVVGRVEKITVAKAVVSVLNT